MRAEKALKLSKRKDWYKILGFSKTAFVHDIKRAYQSLALQWHPDKNADNREEDENKFWEIAGAYEVPGWISLTQFSAVLSIIMELVWSAACKFMQQLFPTVSWKSYYEFTTNRRHVYLFSFRIKQ